jgi:Tfp pilus assembly protein PilV
MLQKILNNKGFTLIDALFAMVITTLGVLAMLTLLPQGWSSSRTSDDRSRAAMIMHSEFENVQALLSNKCNPAPIGSPFHKTINSSGLAAAIIGDQTFTVDKTITGGPTIWTVTVQVTWPGTTTGVSDTHQVVQQDDFTFPSDGNTPPGCTSFTWTGTYN